MNQLLLILSFLLSFMQAPQTSTINVTDHDIFPGKDVTFEVNQLVASLNGQKNVTLYFPKGRYEFYPENAVETFRAVTNHDNGLKRMVFPLFDFEDFTLDGGGSTFIFHGRISPIVLDRSKNIIFKKH